MITMKMVRGYSTQFLGQCLPKNALYFRSGDFVAYCDDFGQFARQKTVSLHIMNLKGNGRFKTVLVRSNNAVAKVFEREIIKRGISALKCENVMCLKRAHTLPELRSPKLRQERMKPDASGTITDCSLEKESGSFVAAAIIRDYNSWKR